jgi:phage gpG-like protein
MPIMAERKEGKEFELPTEGTVQAVLAEVIDKGLVDQVYNGVAKKVHKILLRWQLAELDSEKQPKRIYERYTLSLHEKSGLYKRIKGLFGKEPPQSLDLEKLVGTNTNLVVVHNEGKDKSGQPKTYANIAATLKLQPAQKKLEIVAIPKKDEVKAEVAKSLAVTEANPITDDDIPF